MYVCTMTRDAFSFRCLFVLLSSRACVPYLPYLTQPRFCGILVNRGEEKNSEAAT
jgi:hypothetical protein